MTPVAVVTAFERNTTAGLRKLNYCSPISYCLS